MLSQVVITEMREQDFPMNEDELFYKEYYMATQNPKNLRKFLEKIDPAKVIQRRLIVPELCPERISYNMEDDEYFLQREGSNIFLSRHNRYTPAFLHKHSFFEIVYCMAGHCAQSIGMGRLELHPGDISFLAPGTFHTMEVFDEDSLIFNILLRHGSFYEMFAPVLQRNNIISNFFAKGVHEGHRISYLLFHTDQDAFLREEILEMFQEQEQADEYTDQMLIGGLIRDIGYLMRYYRDTMETAISGQTILPDNFLVMNYIQERLSHVTLSEVAKQFNFSVSYCSRLIKSSTGMGFSDWKRILRLRRAEYMLINTNQTIAEISDGLGYMNPETFIRAFRREFRVSPARYRKNRLNV